MDLDKLNIIASECLARMPRQNSIDCYLLEVARSAVEKGWLINHSGYDAMNLHHLFSRDQRAQLLNIYSTSMPSSRPTTSSSHEFSTIEDGLKFDAIPRRVKPLESGEESVEVGPPASTQSSGAAAYRTIKIFLASSSELEQDRNAFDLYFRQENDRLRKQGIYLQIVRWENFLDAMSETSLQDEYNTAIRNSDIFVSLFKTKTGQYTEGEFDAAHQAFRKSGKPLIYTYFMRANVPTDRRYRRDLNSLWDFQEKLSQLGHYYSEYSDIKDLQLQFRRQLDKLIEDDKV